MDILVKRQIDAFFKHHSCHTFKKGDLLVIPDSVPKGVFYLTKGIVRQYATSLKGEEFVVNIFNFPAFFPMSYVLNESLPTHYFEAMNDVVAWEAPKEKFLEFLKNNPDVLLDLVKRTYKGLDEYMLRLESMMTGSAYTRLIIELLIDAKRFGKKIKNKGVELRLTQDELAAESGIARETISREMKKLKDKMLVVANKHKLVISSLKKLEEELQY